MYSVYHFYLVYQPDFVSICYALRSHLERPGAISGNLLPDFMMSALSVAIYGMFLAIIIPPAKQNKAVLAVVVAAMLISTLFKVIPFLSEVSSGFVIIITTLIVAGAAAYFCPIEDEKEEESVHES